MKKAIKISKIKLAALPSMRHTSAKFLPVLEELKSLKKNEALEISSGSQKAASICGGLRSMLNRENLLDKFSPTTRQGKVFVVATE